MLLVIRILLLCFSAALVQADLKPPTDAPVKCRLRSVSSNSTPCSSVVSFTVKAVPTSCSSQTASQITTPVVVSAPCQSSSIHVTTTGYPATTRPFGMTSSSHGSSQSTPCSTSQKLTSTITTLKISTKSLSLPLSTPSSLTKSLSLPGSTRTSLTTQVTQSTSATVCSSCSNSRTSKSTTTSAMSSTVKTTTTSSKELYSSSTPDAPMTRPPLRPPSQVPPSPGPPETAPPPRRRPPGPPSPGPPPPSERPPSERPPSPTPPSERPPSNRPPSEPPSPPTRPPPPPSEPPPPTDGSEPPTASPPPPPRPPSSSTPKPPSPKSPTIKRNRKGGKGGTKGDSPLVFDVNKDGAVSASKNTGISKDPSNPNNQDGGAVGGDKMLAMSDLNGNGVVDIQEVFGDHTLSPFTKKPYYAANGFDALYMLALEMQSIPQCKFQLVKKDHNSVLVSLTSVKRCLNLHNVQLGFISDTNISDLEELGDVDQVDVTDYVNTPDDVRNGVLHGQKGFFYSQDGTKLKVDDVWFRK
ncbi:hypothetical protein MIR68_004468 [Amoeboaphelidium protococcarum]|nr:hypothetical protein MIR68_004468 [Amoeboaphelidium protococcarum]